MKPPTHPRRQHRAAGPHLDATPGLAARRAAAGLISAVLDRRTPLDLALARDAAFAALPARDRALARAIVGSALRRHGTLKALLASLVATPPHAAGLLPILEVGAAQLLLMDVPAHAAVALAVDAADAAPSTRRYRGLVNAVLRRIAREGKALLATIGADADTPAWLLARWRDTYGDDTTRAIAAAHRLEPYLDLSVKDDPAGWAARLGGTVLPTGTVRLLASGPVDALPGFAEGAWWVQDAAAALPVRLLGDIAGRRVVDLCAAPGGKTAALIRTGAEVTAVEAAPERMRRLAANLARLDYRATLVTADAATWAPAASFDAVLLDAPCSATGTIRRHPDVAWLKRPGDIPALAALQSRLLAAAARMLRSGGTLVFCTCSLEPEEGEAHLAGAAALGLVPEPIAPAEVGGIAGLVAPAGTLRTHPAQLALATPRLSGLDGFFAMRLRKG